MSNKNSVVQYYNYTIDHYELLKNMVKSNNCGGVFEEENYKIKNAIWFKFRNKDNCLFCFYMTLENSLDIRLMSGRVSKPDFEWFIFDKCRNTYVFQNLREIVSVWINLALKYRDRTVIKSILNDYILYKARIEKHLKIMEIASRFRKQCLMHQLPIEVRKKIYDAVLKTSPVQLLECREFSKNFHL